MTYMNLQHAEASAHRRLCSALFWPAVVASVVYVLLLALGGRLLGDADIYWQMELGHWMMAHGQVPHVDTFSYTMAGKPWISSQWLAQVLYAAVYDVLGWNGVVVLAALSIAAALGLLMHFLQKRLATVPALVLVIAAFMLAAPHLVARPHALALPVMVAWVGGLVRSLDERRRPPFVLLPLMTLWANLHGGFTLGIAILAPIALEALWRAASEERAQVFLRWTLFGVLTVAAACITPYGPQSILVTGRILGLGPALALIDEWKPQDFATLTGFAFCLLGGIGAALYRGITLPPIRLLVVLGLLYMGLSHVRNGEVLGLLAPLFMAAPLAPQVGRREAPEPGDRGASLLATFAMVLALAGVTVGMARFAGYEPGAGITPERAVAALKASGRKHVFNSYGFGGYLIASDVRPFIDGRTELYGTGFVLDHDRAVRLEDVGLFLKLLRRYNVDVTLLAPGTPAIGLLDRMKGWKRIYADDRAVVHIRTSGDAATEEEIDR